MTETRPLKARSPVPRRKTRRVGRRAEDLKAIANLPVPAGEAVSDTPSRERVTPSRGASAAGPAGTVDAQLLGQDGVKRGLRGGAPVLDAARTAYLEAEYSGRHDRRPKAGRITRTEI